jgi:hypothetical protein
MISAQARAPAVHDFYGQFGENELMRHVRDRVPGSFPLALAPLRSGSLGVRQDGSGMSENDRLWGIGKARKHQGNWAARRDEGTCLLKASMLR